MAVKGERAVRRKAFRNMSFSSGGENDKVSKIFIRIFLYHVTSKCFFFFFLKIKINFFFIFFSKLPKKGKQNSKFEKA
jgi:hypothetical protein